MASKRFEIFISGSLTDLREYRQVAIEASFRVGAIPVAPEFMMATGEHFEARWGSLDRSDAYLAIIGERYGAPTQGEGISPTEEEYEIARKRGIPRLIFVKSAPRSTIDADPESLTRLYAFMDKVRQSGFLKEFRSIEDFKAEVVIALANLVHSLSRGTERKSVLLLVPKIKSSLRAFLSKTIERSGIHATSVDEISGGTRWADALTNELRQADIIVADVTDSNPNVMYGLGFAQSLRKPTIILAEQSSAHSAPIYLGGYNILMYEIEDFTSLEKPLMRFIRKR